MPTVFMLNRKEVEIPEKIDEIFALLKEHKVEPSLDLGGIIQYGDLLFLVYRTPPSVGAIAKALGVSEDKIKKIREFEERGSGRYLIYEDVGIKIEVIR